MIRLFRRATSSPRVLNLLLGVVVCIVSSLLGRPPLAAYNRLLLVLGGGVAVLLILMREPASGLVIMASLSFTLPITLGTGTDVSLTPPVVLIALIALSWALNGLGHRSLVLQQSRTVRPLALFVTTGIVSLVAGRAYWDPAVPQPGNLLLVQLGQWGIFALSALIFVLATTLGTRRRWLEAATWVFLALGSLVVLEFFIPPLRLAVGWSDGNMANRSMFWTWLAALAGSQLLFNRRLATYLRYLLLTLLFSAAYVVWFRQSVWTSGWAPFTVSVSVVFLLWMWRRSRTGAMVALAMLVLIATLIGPAAFAHTGGEQELDISWGGRTQLYRATLDLVKDHPLLGLGPAAYRQYGFTHWLGGGVGRALWIRPNVSSHNNFIDLYAQTGLVGLLLFLWFLIELAVLGAKLLRRYDGDFRDGYVNGALAGLGGTIVAMMLADWFLPFVYNIGFPGFRTSALAWMFLGGLVALEHSDKQPAGSAVV